MLSLIIIERYSLLSQTGFEIPLFYILYSILIPHHHGLTLIYSSMLITCITSINLNSHLYSLMLMKKTGSLNSNETFRTSVVPSCLLLKAAATKQKLL